MEYQLTIRRINSVVYVAINGMGVGIPWDVAISFASLLSKAGKISKKYAAAARTTGPLPQSSFKESTNEIIVESVGPAVIVQIQGKRWFECNYRQTPGIATAVLKLARQIEEEVKAAQLIADEAILLRTGLPVGLAFNKKIKQEAWKEAESVKLRTMVEPQTMFMPPTLILHEPKHTHKEN